MKKIAIALILLIISFLGFNSLFISKASYKGKGLEWAVFMKFDKNDKCVINIDYLGAEELPLNVIFNIEYPSSNVSEGIVEYTKSYDEIGGFTMEYDYDENIHGKISKCKENLKVVIKWNSNEEEIILNKIS